MKDLSRLHDATLVSFTVIWADALCVFYLRTQTGDVRAEIRELTSLSLERVEPWGASPSVLEIRQVQRSGASEVMIQLQSGDVIKVCGQLFWTE